MSRDGNEWSYGRVVRTLFDLEADGGSALGASAGGVGGVVAERGPPLPGRAKSVDDARLADLVRRGILTPPLMKAAAPPRSIPMLPIREILRGLDEDRSER